MVSVDYGQRFALAMRQAGKSTQQIADGLRLSYQAIAKVLAGTTKMLAADNNARAARMLGVDSDWLATGEGAMTRPERVSDLSDDDAAVLAAYRALDNHSKKFALEALSYSPRGLQLAHVYDHLPEALRGLLYRTVQNFASVEPTDTSPSDPEHEAQLRGVPSALRRQDP